MGQTHEMRQRKNTNTGKSRKLSHKCIYYKKVLRKIVDFIEFIAKKSFNEILPITAY